MQTNAYLLVVPWYYVLNFYEVFKYLNETEQLKSKHDRNYTNNYITKCNIFSYISCISPRSQGPQAYVILAKLKFRGLLV